MRGEIELRRDDFREAPCTPYRTDGLAVTAFAYPSGVEALKLENRRGHLVVLPYLDQMIWAAAFARPSTCEPEAYKAERRKGHVAALAPGATRRFEVVTCYLSAAEARNA
ncbi:hypothetical protein BFF94_027700 [Burkholderia catarinensis]|nr:hypothetical protein BFF94_027700 [Burkholderia catarinensis]